MQASNRARKTRPGSRASSTEAQGKEQEWPSLVWGPIFSLTNEIMWPLQVRASVSSIHFKEKSNVRESFSWDSFE